jgi:putative transposase
MTLPPCYSWSPVGQNLSVAYEAPQGRRLNAIGGFISHGPDAGTFRYAVYASLPKQKGKKQRTSAEARAASYGLSVSEVGAIDSPRFLAFVWQLAGRPLRYAPDWKRARALTIVLDNYSVHKSEEVKEARAALEAANIFLFYLPSYSPELSEIEPVWQTVKHHDLQERSHTDLQVHKRYVEQALGRRATALADKHKKTTIQLCAAA